MAGIGTHVDRADVDAAVDEVAPDLALLDAPLVVEDGAWDCDPFRDR